MHDMSKVWAWKSHLIVHFLIFLNSPGTNKCTCYEQGVWSWFWKQNLCRKEVGLLSLILELTWFSPRPWILLLIFEKINKFEQAKTIRYVVFHVFWNFKKKEELLWFLTLNLRKQPCDFEKEKLLIIIHTHMQLS
jgi:hypothetical protein